MTVGGIKTLVNNAGIAHIGKVHETEPEDLDRIYNVNIKGVYNCLHNAVKLFLNNGGGTIANMASVASTMGIPDRFAYSTSKGAVYMMTRSVAVDYLDNNIRCSCISAARVHTPFVDGYLAKTYSGQEKKCSKNYQRLGRLAEWDSLQKLLH
jgi:2-keto-3-deoxy-L-fuconate dehydrogenase